MKLKRLIIQGFKSFKDRTTVNFDEGITGIVGPNGCGKSNIVDALFWIMGEQSAKHLRGNSMKELIFAGSSKYSPASFAEATLVLENNKGKHIHIGNKVASPSEIQLTRKLYRNGETEYRINDQPCRLRDIQEVFMDTGAGAKSYSIIAQGEINRLVQAKPEERRTMIEDVAGITKFKMRKRESLKKIEATQANLNRLQDLQSEIEKNLRALQKQAEKAERARTLRDKVKRNDLIVNAHKVFDHLKNYRDEKNLINEKTLEVETWTTRKNQLEISLEDERHQKDEKMAKLDEMQNEYNEVSKQLAAAEEKLNYLCKTQSEKEKQIEVREKECEELALELQNRIEKLEELKTQHEQMAEANAQEIDFSDLEETVEQLKEELELKQDEASQLEEELESQKEELNTLNQTITRNNDRMGEFSANLQDITQEIEALESQYSGVSKDIGEEREASQAALALSEELAEKEVNFKATLEQLKNDYRNKSDEFNSKTKELIQKESKLVSLKEINASLEGSKEGAASFIKTHEDKGFSLLGTHIRCDEKYAQAVQTVLNDFMNVVVAEESDLALFSTWLESNSELGIDYLKPSLESKISEESIERLRLKGCENLISFVDIIECSAEMKSKLTPFLEGYFICKNVNVNLFEKLGSEIHFRAIVSEDGKNTIFNQGGATLLSTKGSENQSQGIVERNNKIEELEKELSSLKETVEALELESNDLKEKLEQMNLDHDQLRSDLSEAKADYASKSSALESKLANMESGHARLDILKNRKSEVSKQRLEIMESEESLNDKQESLSSSVEDLATRLEELEDSIELIKSSYSEKKEELVEKQIEARSIGDRLKGVESQIEDVTGQIERQESRLATNKDLINNLSDEVTTIETELADLESSNHETANQLQDKEDVLSILRDDLAQLLQAMQERENDVKELNKAINSTEKELAQLEAKLGQHVNEEEQIVRNIFEKYRIDLRENIGKFLEYTEEDYQELQDISSMFVMETEEGTKEIEKESYEFHRRYGQDLKDCESKYKNYKTELARLGEINWQAIEDYERQKLRFDFLKIQEQELKQSLEDLEKAIAHIDEKSRERFKIAFEEVDVRFQKVFPIIFGGGAAQLKVTGDINDAECGVEIIAQPPGKKMQNINLMSGGEKAMTAVSLIFSIFLVKPAPFCLLDEVDAPLDDANVGRFNELLREMSAESQFILITHNKKTMELNDTLYGVTMQEPGVSKAVSVQLH